MSDRERWIIYPLLIFALALSFRNSSQRTGIATFNKVKCNSVQIDATNGDRRIMLSATPNSGQVSIYGHHGNSAPVVQLRAIQRMHGGEHKTLGSVGQLEVRNDVTRSRGLLTGYENGANLELFSHPYVENLAPSQPILIAGFNQVTQTIGLTAVSPHTSSAALQKQTAVELDDNGMTFLIKNVSITENEVPNDGTVEVDESADADNVELIDH